MVFHFYNTCLNSFNISSHFSDGIIISSTYLKFSSGFTVLSAIMFPIKSSAASAALGLLFWKQFLKVILVLAALSNNCVPYLLDRFLENNKNPHPLTYFHVL